MKNTSLKSIIVLVSICLFIAVAMAAINMVTAPKIEEQRIAAEQEALAAVLPENDGFEKVDEQVTAKSKTNLRTAPDLQESEIVYTLENGEYLQRIGVSQNGWSKLLYNGEVVYAVTSYLEEK